MEKVDTDDLAIGMYVSRLDRPWLETPFLFQGFTIKSAAEIDELKRYCRFVYVDGRDEPGGPEQRDKRPAQLPPVARQAPKARFSRFFRWLRKRSEQQTRPGRFYADTLTLEAELPQAKQIHSRASSVFVDAMETIRRGGKLDVQVLETAVQPMIESVLRNSDAMTWLSRIKQIDDYTYGHSVSCSVYAIAFGRHLGLAKEDLKVLGLGGMLLDVGKARIPKELLTHPGKLAPEQMAVMRRHVQFGEEMVREHPSLDERVLTMVRSHHERYDGSGYPEGLKGPDIHVFARIAGIVDFYDALITPRPYAAAVSAYDAMRELHQRAGSEFQTEMVDHFVQAVGMFPNGALVELSTGEVAIVVEQNQVRRLRPKVLVILDADKQPLETCEMLDLRERPSEREQPEAVWIDRGLEVGAYGIEPGDYYL